MNKKLIFVGVMLVVSSTIFAQQESKIEEVTIASKTKQQLYKTGKNVRLISEKDLEKYKGQTINDVLNQVAGFQITGSFNNNPEPKSLKIRGGENANIVILLDGIPLKDVTGNDYNVSDLRLMALENIESIEILNGASSVLYGSNATVSVINIKTKKTSKKPIEGLLSTRGGSFSTFAQNTLFKGKIENFNYQILGFNEKSEGVSAALGDESFDKDGFEKQNISANVGFSTKMIEININTGWNHHLYKFDNGAFTDGTKRGNDKQYFLGGNANFKYNKGNLVLNTRYTNTNRLAQNLANNFYQNKYQYKGDNFFTELYNSYTINDFVNITGGIQHEKQSMAYSAENPWGSGNLVEVLKSGDTHITMIDAFIAAHFTYKEFNLDAGTRFTNHSKFGNHWVYSINPFYLKEHDALYFKLGYSYATAFIAPTLYQNFGSLPWTAANFELQPETNESHEIDLSLGKKDRSINFTASIFLRKEKASFAYITIDPKNFIGQFQNVDDNKVKGFELGFDYQIHKIIKLGGNFSYVEKNKEATMLRQPKQRINSYLEITPFRATRINISQIFTGKRADVYYDSSTFSNQSVEIGSFMLFNVNINQKITPRFDAYLSIGNVLNKNYIDVVGYTIKQRNYTFGTSYTF